MKILSRKEFIKLPAGTVFSYYEPCAFRGLFIKDSERGEWLPDFVCSDLIGAVEINGSEELFNKCKKMENGESLPVDFESSGREGLFDDKLLYAIYETEDVKKLIQRLKGLN